MRRLFRLWRLSGRDLRLLMRALRSAERPPWLWPASLGLAFFALEPFNFAIPVLGIVDDMILLPLLLRGLVSLIGLAPGADGRPKDPRVVSIQ